MSITQISPATMDHSIPNASTSPGSQSPVNQFTFDTHKAGVNGTPVSSGSAETRNDAIPNTQPFLADPLLALTSDVLDDTERTKIANQNRLRQLTRSVSDSDGETRGFGLTESHPDVARLAALVDLLEKVEHQAVLNLQRSMRAHPLGPWVESQKGIGLKQFARLLAKIGDPFWNSLYDRPRTVSELWTYCGLHTVPVSHCVGDTHGPVADGDSSTAGGDHPLFDTQASHVAARRQKGQRANWSTEAKSRAYLISESMLKAGNRAVYDNRKAATEGRLHAVPCVRCGPAGKPAQAGSGWSDGHRHADALRVQAKEMLKGLWLEAKRLHLSHPD